MARGNTTNRFAGAGQALVGSETMQQAKATEPEASTRKKDKIVTAKVYPDTWAAFTAINKAQGMTNNSVINMLVSEYVRNKKEILE